MTIPTLPSPDDINPEDIRPLPEQQAFINRATRSHALLVAGPGTGKTWTLSKTAECLLGLDGTTTDHIALLTLTRSMTASLAERIPHGRASTLHSFALTLLNRLGEAHNRRIADPWEQDNLIRGDLQEGVRSQFGDTPNLRQVDDFLDRLATSFREDQREPANLSDQDRQMLAVLDAQKEMFKYRLIDELVWTLLRLLEQGVQIQNVPRFILADEYQDLTAGELRLLHFLAQHFGARVIACGDDRQSIFGFRDADLLALHRFPKVYQVDTIDYLSKSKRCPERICQFAESIAALLPQLPGIDRPVLRPWDGRAELGSIRVILAPSPIAEARWVVREIRDLIITRNVRPLDVLVITAGYRVQVQALLNQAIQESADGLFEFYDPAGFDPIANALETRLLSAAVRLIKDPEDHLAWRTLVWAIPGLGRQRRRQILTAGRNTYLQNLQTVAARDAVSARALAAGDSIVGAFRGRGEVSAVELVQHISAQLGIACDLAVVRSLITKVGHAESLDSWIEAIFELSQKTQIDPSQRPRDIPVRTIFGAKGLEAQVVFLVNAIPPSFNVGGRVADGLRRLYVAVTRAIDTLYISAAGNLRYTPLGHASGASFGGLLQQITDTAGRLRINVDRIQP